MKITPIEEVQPVFFKLIKALVDEPEALVLKVVKSEVTTVFHVYVSKNDLGKIIGKQGRTAQAIRLLLASTSKKYNQRFDIVIEQV